MSGAVKIAFGSLTGSKGSALVVFVGADMKPAPAVTAQFGDLEPLIRAAAKASNFRAAQRTALDILGATKAHKVFGALTRGAGIVFTLHHVRPDDGRAFAPNRLLEITPQFLETVQLEASKLLGGRKSA